MSLRAFVAVPVRDEAVLERLAAATRGLALDGVKWTAAHQLHFTLKFMGELPEELLAPAKDALAAAAAQVERFPLRLDGLGVFPPHGPARVVWAGCAEGRASLEELAGRVESAFVGAGVAPEERPFKAHLTVGRVKDFRAGKRAAEAVRAAGATDLGTVDVHELVLFQSALLSGGPAHTPLARAKLGGG